MSVAAALLPDFALILLGIALYRFLRVEEAFWSGLEKLVYYVLFPALLVNALSKTGVDFRAAAPLIATGVGFTLAGMALGWAARWLFRLSSSAFASGFQCAFRFNTYVGFAVVGRVDGEAGIAAMALLAGALIPIVNVAAVSALARHAGSGWLRELAANPLILGTAAGIALGVSGAGLPEPARHTLALLGNAALPMGLIAVGAGLRITGGGDARGAMAWWLAVKLLALPAIAWWLSGLLGLEGVYRHTAILFAALPTASSAYILAVRMGGDGRLVASLIAANVAVAMFTIPFWLSVALG